MARFVVRIANGPLDEVERAKQEKRVLWMLRGYAVLGLIMTIVLLRPMSDMLNGPPEQRP